MKSVHAAQLLSTCRICGESAMYSYFGAVSCHPCKMFFRRNAKFGLSKFICPHQGQCQIDGFTRRICGFCRIKKCFQVGMSMDKFRASIQKGKRPSSTQRLDQDKSMSKLPTVSFNHFETSQLERYLSSNTDYSQTELNLLSIGRRYMTMHYVQRITPAIAGVLVQEFLSSLYTATEAFLRYNADFCQLSCEDSSIILHSAADKVSCMIGSYAMHYYGLLACDEFSKCIKMLYGGRAVERTLAGLKFIDSDTVLVKSAISLFALEGTMFAMRPQSSSPSMHPRNLFYLQNKYAVLVWKYLVYYYGEHQAIKKFLKLIGWMHATIGLVDHVQRVQKHVDDVESLVEQTEIALILDVADQLMETHVPN